MIKVGIIGCGKITQLRHAPEYAENKDCQLVAFFDSIPERAEALAKEYGGAAYSSVEALLESDVDAVSICVANVAHGAISVQALNAGKHVLCEKPMAITLEECQQMNAAAKSNNKFLMVAQNQRFAKAHVEARKLIESGAIGKVLTFETHFCHSGPENWTGEKDSWFFDKNTAIFGAMADLGVHKTDLIHFLLGEAITEVSASLQVLDKKHPDGTPINIDDNAFCIYKTDSGAIGTMHVSWTCYGNEKNNTIIFGTEGVLRCYDHPEHSLLLEKSDGTVKSFELEKMASNEEQKTGGSVNTGVIDSFIESIKTNTQPAISGEEAIKAMKVVFACEQSSIQKKTLRVDQN